MFIEIVYIVEYYCTQREYFDLVFFSVSNKSYRLMKNIISNWLNEPNDDFMQIVPDDNSRDKISQSNRNLDTENKISWSSDGQCQNIIGYALQ